MVTSSPLHCGGTVSDHTVSDHTVSDEAVSDEAVSDEAGSDEAGSDLTPVPSRKPDAIAREIELTRAELADTIDAIADRISPKRAVSRGRQAVRAQVSSVTGRGQNEPTRVISLDEPAPAAQPTPPSSQESAAPAEATMAPPVLSGSGLATPAGPPASAGVDPRLLAAGAAVGATVALIAIRRKRS